jgi:hypothetical protein
MSTCDRRNARSSRRALVGAWALLTVLASGPALARPAQGNPSSPADLLELPLPIPLPIPLPLPLPLPLPPLFP